MAVEQYRQYIRHLLSERAQRSSMQRNAQEYEVQTIFDSEHDHYQLLYVGWRGRQLEELMQVYRRGLVRKARAMKVAVERGLKPALNIMPA